MKKMGIINCALSARDADIIPPWNIKPDEMKERIGPGEAPNAVAWDTLTEQQKKFQATKMVIHAAMISRMDTEIGRVVRQLKRMDAYDNTLILFVSDNGASAEQIIRGDGHDPSVPMGSAKSYLCLGPGWSTAANTPFRLHKYWNHEGGISSPLIVHWPKGIKAAGELRHSPSHFIDIVPTVMELAAGVCPTNSENEEAVPVRPGKSLVAAFAEDRTVEHEYLWWAHENNRAIRHDDWKLSARRNEDGKTGEWELYNVSIDRCEMNDLALKHPEKVNQLSQKFEDIAESFRKGLI